METNQKKKLSREQLERRIKNALLLVDKTKETKSVYFDDKGVKLSVNGEYALVETGYHRHVFSLATSNGYSRPYIYTQQVIEIALEDCPVEEGRRSYSRLIDVLEARGDDESMTKRTILKLYEWWLQNIFAPLYLIGETELESFLVFEDYVHVISRNNEILREREKDVTAKEFVENVYVNAVACCEGVADRVVLKKLTDEEIVRENMEAMQEQDFDDVLKEGENGQD